MLDPYAPPESDVTLVPEPGTGVVLAGRGARFVGAFVDGVLMVVVMVVIVLVLIAGGLLENFEEFGQLGFVASTGLSLGLFVIYMAINWASLKTNGQTLGKKAAGTRIVTMDGRVPEMNDLVFKRYLFFHLVGLVPLVGWIASLVNILFIFRGDRRCLHDLIANTQVVVR